MYERIVVPFDGSGTAWRAIEPAARLARTWDVPIELVTVVPAGSDGAKVQADLERAVEGLDARIRSPAVLADDDVAGALVGRARGEGEEPALLCMATHGRSAVASALLGSTTQAVLHRVDAPVMLVGPACDADGAGVDVCVAIEPGSAMSARALSPAIGLALASGARLHLVAAHRLGALRAVGDGLRVEDDDGATQQLGELARFARSAGVDTRWRVVDGNGDVAGAVLHAAERASASMIVAAAHSRRAPARRVMGSVAQRLVRQARCPVLLVPLRAAASGVR